MNKMSEKPEEMPDNVTDQPLVTFALFAYNQEQYIREAVEGAFAQTYEPLEIILSDDCSSDRTFEIMQEMAAVYEGPHEVILNRLEKNIGTIDHVLRVARKACGQLIVVAAGDDISLPDRTEKLTDVWVKTGAAVVYSGRLIMNDDGITTGIESNPEPMQRIQAIFSGTNCAKRYGGKVRNIPGYSAAYATNFIASIPECGVGALNEDALTTMMANIQSFGIEAVELPLVRYRYASTSLSPRSEVMTIQDIIQRESRAAKFSRSSAVFFPFLFELIRQKPDPSGDLAIVLSRLEDIYRESILICSSHEFGFFKRTALLTQCRSLSECKLVGSRLMGIHFYALIKFAVINLTRRWVQ